MADRGFPRVPKALALVPLALLSVAWTVSLVSGSGSSSTGSLRDGSAMPSGPLHGPASLAAPRGVVPGDVSRLVPTASASGIPAVALRAYQRAAAILDTADPGCHLPWQLVAAIGRVETDHGRSGGHVLADDGVAHPKIVGPVLGGAAHGARAVGPMQFLASTWAIVGVDADGDGRRDPQDIDDASLGTAVYLCAGNDDLGTDAGRRAALQRYNHHESYVALVLAITHAYLDGEFAAVPNATTSISFSFGTPRAKPGDRHARHPGRRQHREGRHQHSPTGPPDGPSAAPVSDPTSGPGSDPSDGTSSGPTGGPRTKVPLPSVPTALPSDPATVLTRAEAIAQCLAEGLVDNPLDASDAFDRCVFDLTH